FRAETHRLRAGQQSPAGARADRPHWCQPAQVVVTAAPFIDSGIFRAYDIRGIVGQGLDAHSVRLIGQAIGSEVLEQGSGALYVAADARLSSPELALALREGLLAAGCRVVDLGVVPTPLLYFATHAGEYD